MRSLRQFTLSKWKSAGRNSSGRITIFHRGGGSKRLQRRIDLKRSTSSMGIVERIEYDPNRSSRIALVRWINGVQLGRPRKRNTIEEFAPPRKTLEPTTTSIHGSFSLSSLPGKVDQRKAASFSPGLMAGYAVVGLPAGMSPRSKGPFTSKGAGSKKTCATDVLFSALSSPKAKDETAPLWFGGSSGFPRIAVAGAKPAFFAPRMREKVGGKNTFSPCEIQKWQSAKNSSRYRNYPSLEVAHQKFHWFPYPSLPRANQFSRRLICSAATNAALKQVEQSNIDAPKEVILKDDKLPDYFFNTGPLEMIMSADGTLRKHVWDWVEKFGCLKLFRYLFVTPDKNVPV